MAVSIGIGIAYGGSFAWGTISPSFSKVNIPSISAAAASMMSQPTDGTSISGLVRRVRYTALEEEDIIDAAALSLPSANPDKITASSYIVRNISRNFTEVERDADRMLPIASVTKLVTAIVARTEMDQNDRITLNQSIMATYGNTAQFRVGETFSVKDLMYPLLMVSSNDAAEALAQYHGRRQFIQAMNDFAQSVGAYRTYFDDPSGLSSRNISTAKDVTLILNWIRVNDPEIIKITSEKARVVRGHTWVNPTHFLNWSYYLGGKNGYTPEADRTAASLFTAGENGEIYAVVVLGSSSRDSDMMKLLEKVK